MEDDPLSFADDNRRYDPTEPFNIVRTVALSQSIDKCLRDLATDNKVSVGKVIRFFLVAGMLKYEWEPEELGLKPEKGMA